MPFYVWLIVAVLFVIVEIFTAGFFYACFAAGALMAMAVSLITTSAVWQIIVFSVMSVGLIPISRLFARRVSDQSVPQAGADALVGMTGTVIETIHADADKGKVRVDGQIWRADAAVIIEAGRKIKVTAVRGAKLLVDEVVKNGGRNE